jgi:hypothetical protein
LTPTTHLLAGIDARLGLGGGFLDAQLGNACSIALAMPPSRLHLLDVGQRRAARSWVSRST